MNSLNIDALYYLQHLREDRRQYIFHNMQMQKHNIYLLNGKHGFSIAPIKR